MIIKNNPLALNVLRRANEQHQSVQKTIGKLSSGEEVTKAMDGPSTLIASEKMRGRISALNQASRNNEASVSMLQTAEGALSEISGILTRMKQITIHAANEAANDPDTLGADQMELEYLMGSINNIARSTSFGENKLLDGSRGVNGVTVGDHLTFLEASAETGVSPVQGFEIDITQVASKSYMVGKQPLTLESIGDGFQITIQEQGKVAEMDTRRGEVGRELKSILSSYYDNPDNYDPENVSEQIRSVVGVHLQKSLDEAGVPVDTWFSDSGLLVLQHKQYGSDPRFSVSCTQPGLITDKVNIADRCILGKDVQGTFDGEQGMGKGQLLTGGTGIEAEGAVVRFDLDVGFEEQFTYDDNGAVTSVTLAQVEPEGIRPGDVDGYLHISQQSPQFLLGSKEKLTTYSLPDVRTNRMSLGVDNKSGFRSLADIDVTTTQGAVDASRIISKAIDEVAEMRADVGAFQKNRVERTSNLMQVTNENSVRAESGLRDADVAEQMSNLAREQIQLSASQAMLAQANQRPQSVLQLIR